MSSLPPWAVVLVHGAWHTSRSWDPVVPLLRASGMRVEAVDMPGRGDPAAVGRAGLGDFVDAVIATIDDIGGPVVLVGHSLAGLTLGQVADDHPDRVSGLLHVAAFVPRPGQSVADLAAAPAFATSHTFLQESHVELGYSTFPRARAREAFYGEAPREAADAAARMLVAESLGVFAEPLGAADSGSGRVRRAYVECLRDRAVPLAMQRQMYRSAGIGTVFPLDTDHSPFLSRPVELAGLIERFAGAG